MKADDEVVSVVIGLCGLPGVGKSRLSLELCSKPFHRALSAALRLTQFRSFDIQFYILSVDQCYRYLNNNNPTFNTDVYKNARKLTISSLEQLVHSWNCTYEKYHLIPTHQKSLQIPPFIHTLSRNNNNSYHIQTQSLVQSSSTLCRSHSADELTTKKNQSKYLKVLIYDDTNLRSSSRKMMKSKVLRHGGIYIQIYIECLDRSCVFNVNKSRNELDKIPNEILVQSIEQLQSPLLSEQHTFRHLHDCNNPTSWLYTDFIQWFRTKLEDFSQENVVSDCAFRTTVGVKRDKEWNAESVEVYLRSLVNEIMAEHLSQSTSIESRQQFAIHLSKQKKNLMKTQQALSILVQQQNGSGEISPITKSILKSLLILNYNTQSMNKR